MVVGGVFCVDVVGVALKAEMALNFPFTSMNILRVSFFVKRVWNTRKNAIFERKKMYLYYIFFFISFFLYFVCIGVCMGGSMGVSHFLVTR